MANTIKSERKALYAELNDAVDARVTEYYDHEPRVAAKPASITVDTVAVRPDFFIYEIRLYVWFAADPATEADLRDDLIQAADGVLTSRSGPSNWDVSLLEQEDANGVTAVGWLCVSRVEVGREDYTE